MSTALKKFQVSEHFIFEIFSLWMLTCNVYVDILKSKKFWNLKPSGLWPLALQISNLYNKLLTSLAFISFLHSGDCENGTFAFPFPTLCHPLKNFRLVVECFWCELDAFCEDFCCVWICCLDFKSFLLSCSVTYELCPLGKLAGCLSFHFCTFYFCVGDMMVQALWYWGMHTWHNTCHAEYISSL